MNYVHRYEMSRDGTGIFCFGLKLADAGDGDRKSHILVKNRKIQNNHSICVPSFSSILNFLFNQKRSTFVIRNRDTVSLSNKILVTLVI